MILNESERKMRNKWKHKRGIIIIFFVGIEYFCTFDVP